MMCRRQASTTSVVVSLAATLFLLTVTALAVRAQTGRPAGIGPPPAGSRDPFARIREMQQREARLRSAEMTTAESTDQRAMQAAIEQVRQDFKHIQILHNEIVRSLTAAQPLDYGVISEKAGEVNKRANRLKAFLASPPPAEEGKARKSEEEKSQRNQIEFNREEMKDALVTLCKRIESFVENPVFKVTGVVDVQQATRARGDLDQIIQISGGVRKGAERLSKTFKH